jgi:beta-glucosidase
VEERLPADFMWGVATAGFQIEGGYNGPGEPQNNWSDWEASARVEPSGIACDFWRRHDEYIRHCQDMKLNSFRLSIEWARCYPEQGKLDTSAVARYREIIEKLRAAGLEPLVTLHHFTHPLWLGVDFWLKEESPKVFLEWVRSAIEHFGDLAKMYVTLNEINVLPSATYLFGAFPPGRRGDIRATALASDNLLLAHLLAYQEIKKQIPDATVGTNPTVISVYEAERVITDLCLAKRYVEGPGELKDWLAHRREAFYSCFDKRFPAEVPARRLMSRLFDPLSVYRRSIDEVFSSELECFLDVVQIDFYNPYLTSHVRLPFSRTAGGRTLSPTRMFWDDLIIPEAFSEFLRAENEPGIPLWVVENGMCSRVKRGRSYGRSDNWTRPQMLKEYLPRLVQARAEGIDVRGYWHWSLMDNYEWGSYQPRFGILGIDRERGVRVLEEDSMGHDSKGTYARLIEELTDRPKAHKKQK